MHDHHALSRRWPWRRIRFSIIAHIDHMKSTSQTAYSWGTGIGRKMMAQFLDMDLEAARDHVKLNTARMKYKADDGDVLPQPHRHPWPRELQVHRHLVSGGGRL
jgi:hypothetical protein